MKSAYEIALEKMEKESGPSRKLTDEEKARIADINQKYDAKVAETRLNYEAKLATAPPMEREALQNEMREAMASLEEKRDREKDAIWQGKEE